MALFNTKDAQDLLWGPAEDLAAYLGCSLRTARRYKALKTPLPPAAVKLLQLRYGDLAGVLGSDWEGFTLGHDGKLYPPFFRGGFSAAQICAMFFQVQELRHLRRELKRITALYDAASSSAWAMQKVCLLLKSPGEHHANHLNPDRRDHRDPNAA